METERKPIDYTLEELLLLSENNEKNVQYAIGFYYEHGIKTEKSPVAAMLWYERAAKQGHVDAQLRLGLMYAQGNGCLQDFKEAVKWLKKAADQEFAPAVKALENNEL